MKKASFKERKGKKNMKTWIYIALCVVFIGLSVWLTYVIVNSDMPIWLKVLLMR